MRVTYCHLLTEVVSLVSLLQSRGGCDRKMDHIGKNIVLAYYLASDFGVDSVQVTSCSTAEYDYRGNRPHECKFVLRRRGSKERWLQWIFFDHPLLKRWIRCQDSCFADVCSMAFASFPPSENLIWQEKFFDPNYPVKRCKVCFAGASGTPPVCYQQITLLLSSSIS